MLYLFVVVSGISFIGSLHPGPVNLAVIQATVNKSSKAGMWMALGGSLPEFAYAGLAAGGLMAVPSNSVWLQWLPYVSVPVLLIAALAAFIQKPASMGSATVSKSEFPFWKGMLLGGTNPQLLPFWSAVWIYLSGNMLVPLQPTSIWVFALGTTAGAFGLLMGVVWLASKQKQRLMSHLSERWINYLTGSLFAGMAAWQVVQLLDING